MWEGLGAGGPEQCCVQEPTYPHLRSALPHTMTRLSQRDDLSTVALERWDSPPSAGSIWKVTGAGLGAQLKGSQGQPGGTPRLVSLPGLHGRHVGDKVPTLPGCGLGGATHWAQTPSPLPPV